MQGYDLMNGLFEFGAAIFLLINVAKLQRDKKVLGVSVIPVVFMTLWGVFNLFYYPHLHQPISFRGGICVVVVNSVWLSQFAYYKHVNGRAIRSILRARA